MLGDYVNPMLYFREHFTHIVEDVKGFAKTLAKREISPSLKTLAVEQLLKSKYHAAHLGVFNERKLTTIDGILNKAMRQTINLLPNFPTDRVQRPLKEAGLGLPPMRGRATQQLGIEHLVNKDSKRGYIPHAHVRRLISRFGHCSPGAVESNLLKILTLRIHRHVSTIPGIDFKNLPPLH